MAVLLTQETEPTDIKERNGTACLGDGGLQGRNITSKISQLRNTITVEVILFLYIFGGVLLGPTVQALVYRKVCLEKYNLTICDHLDREGNEDFEVEVQTGASHWYLVAGLCFEIPSILLSTFYGSLSDNWSRKVALTLPLIGQILSTTNYVINSVYMELPVGFILFGPFVSGIFGGWVSGGMACFAYLSDVTSEENRTQRVAIAESVISISAAISSLIGGRLLDSTSYEFVLSLALGLFVVTLIYTIVWTRDPPSPKRTGKKDCSAMWQNVLNPQRVKEALAVIFRKREDNGRVHIIVCLSILLSGAVGVHAEFALAYLYLRKQPLNWSQSLYGYFGAYGAVLTAISQLLILPLMQRKLHIRDTNIIVLAFVSMSSSMVLFAFCTKTWMVFLVPLVGILGCLNWVVLRSMLSKMVEKDELGRMFAVFGAIQSLNGLISSVVYNNLYPVTLDFWSGFCFILGATICFIPMSLAAWLGRNLKKYGWGSYGTLDEDKDATGTDAGAGGTDTVVDNTQTVHARDARPMATELRGCTENYGSGWFGQACKTS